MKEEILNNKLDREGKITLQCPNCKFFKTRRHFGININEVRICENCGCKYGIKS